MAKKASKMNYQQAITKCREIGNKAQEHADTADRAGKTYSATMELYNVAASAGDEQTMQKHRDTLHGCVDVILDAGALIGKLTKEQKEVALSVTDWPDV